MKGFLESKIKTLVNGMQVLQMPNSVNFAIVTADKYVILAQQYRASVDEQHVNLYGGYIDKEESVWSALCRELTEETGLNMERDIKRSEFIYSHLLVSSGTSTECNSLAVLFTNGTLAEVEKLLECQDKEENIIHLPKKIDRNFRLIVQCMQGIRSFVAMDYIERMFREDANV